MKISPCQLKTLKDAPNSFYEVLEPEFLFHSNKLEGSTFTGEELQKLLFEDVVAGEHPLDDVYETIGPARVFDYMVDTLDRPVDDGMLFEMNRILFEGAATRGTAAMRGAAAIPDERGRSKTPGQRDAVIGSEGVFCSRPYTGRGKYRREMPPRSGFGFFSPFRVYPVQEWYMLSESAGLAPAARYYCCRLNMNNVHSCPSSRDIIPTRR